MEELQLELNSLKEKYSLLRLENNEIKQENNEIKQENDKLRESNIKSQELTQTQNEKFMDRIEQLEDTVNDKNTLIDTLKCKYTNKQESYIEALNDLNFAINRGFENFIYCAKCDTFHIKDDSFYDEIEYDTDVYSQSCLHMFTYEQLQSYDQYDWIKRFQTYYESKTIYKYCPDCFNYLRELYLDHKFDFMFVLKDIEELKIE